MATGVSGLVAGCTGSTTPTPGDSPAPDEFTNRSLEVLHGWTGGDGARAIRSVERMFRARYPDVGVDLRPIGGTGNENLNSAIDRRLAAGNPPSSFAAWPGQNLVQYEDQLLDVSPVWADEGFANAMHSRAAANCRRDGAYRAVPIGSHRINNLFYNVELLAEAGVDPAELTSTASLVDAMERIEQQTDAAPLAHAIQLPWTNLQLVVQVMLSQAGAAAYRNFVSGQGDRTVLARALDTTRVMLENYVNEDATTISFTEANRKLIRGEAAMITQGSWVYGMYRSADSLAYRTDWDWTPFPGTEGTFVFNLDAFVFPRDNPTPEKTDVWATFVGQPDPQIAFSNRKGSVPVRLDFDSNRLADFPRLIWKDLRDSSSLVPTLAHGLAVEPSTLAACKSVVRERFMGPFEVEATADGLLDALGD